ncbi:MAG: zinc carboxypeptidase, partial [Bacteroidetes bacterium QS_1_63_11]
YFAPAAEPFHEDLTEWQRDFQFTIGHNHAEYFEENGWLYFTEEVFDLFYPGYGDPWPLFNGAIGMTYEQGGSGRAGRAIVTAEGDTLTLTDRLQRHHTTGLSTVEVAARHHDQVVQQFEAYYTSAQEDPPGDYEMYVIRRDEQGHRLSALADHLDRQQIQYGFATETQRVEGRSYRSGSTERVRLQRGDLLVNTAQPKGRLAKVLLEPSTTITDSLMYDITAWSLPYAYGLEAYALTSRVEPTMNTMPVPDASRSGNAASPYAYITPWTSRADVQFAAALLDANIRIRFATEPFTVDKRSYEAGALIVTRATNTNRTDRFDATVRRLADDHDQSLHAASTGFTEQGPDFGSGNIGFIDSPHVAALSGPPTSSSRIGEVWHFFDRQIEYPVTLLPADDFDATMLDDVDVLVLPSGRYGEWLSDERAMALTDWVRQGGRLISMGNANDALASHSAYALTRADRAGSDTAGTTDLAPYSGETRRRLSSASPGSIHRVYLDDSHTLGFGIEPPYFTLKRNDDAFAYLDDGHTVGALQDPTPVSGFMGREAQQKVDETLLFGVQSLGNGHVTYFVDNPLFRGFWYNGQVLFANAVFLTGNR